MFSLLKWVLLDRGKELVLVAHLDRELLSLQLSNREYLRSMRGIILFGWRINIMQGDIQGELLDWRKWLRQMLAVQE